MGKLRHLPERYRPHVLEELDARTNLAQRLTADFQALVDDAGGVETLSRAKLLLMERAVFLVEVMRRWEQQIIENPSNNVLIGRWVQTCNALQGVLSKIGLGRVGETIDINQYIAGRGNGDGG